MDFKPVKPKIAPPVRPAQPVVQELPKITVESVLAPTPPAKKHRIWIIIVAVLLLLATFVGLSAVWYQASLQPLGGESRHVRITILPGETADTITQQLVDEKLIKSRLAFSIYLHLSGKKDKLQAGHYAFSSEQTVEEIVDSLVGGKVDAYNVTILPGKTLAQIKEGLIKDGFSEAEIDEAFAKTYDHPVLADKPAETSLEGYIYPETYQIDANTTVEQLIKRSFDEFLKRIHEKDLVAGLKAQGLNLYQGVNMASIVEREVSKPEDRAKVAQVFLKRFRMGMALGSDPTYMYGAKLLGKEPSINLESPYNTRKYPGLPPSAIANFNVAVLSAVAHPASGEYVYFVAGDDGTVHYSHTEEEHLQKVSQYCHQLCR